MDDSRQQRHRLVLSALVLVSGLLLTGPHIVFATDLGPDGGPGGTPFRFECPKGSYIVGFQAKTGEWIDRLQAICAPWIPNSNSFGPITVGPSFGQSTAKLVQGQYIDPKVTRLNYGRWELRVRMIGQGAVAGPWSAPASFNLVGPQQKQSIQGSSAKSPFLKSPSERFGAGTTVIRPRGVEEENRGGK